MSLYHPYPTPLATPVDFATMHPEYLGVTWRTLGTKHLPDGTVLRLQLHQGTLRRRVQRRVLGCLWLRLPEPLALREALLWNWHQRVAIDAEGRLRTVSVFMQLPRNVELLPLTEHPCELFIVRLYASVQGDEWRDEGCHKWRPLKEFFADRK